MSDRAIILANGSIHDADTLVTRLQPWKGAIVIAANGGVQHAERLGLEISIVIGDLDSLDEEERIALKATNPDMVRVATQKDETDLELALLYATEIGVRDIVVLGAFGDRIDMCLSNLLLLTHPSLLPVRIEYWYDRQTAWLIRPPGDEVHGQSGDTLSLIPLEVAAEGITTHDLYYPLNDERLVFGPARGVSNVLTASVARVELDSGTLIAVHSPAEM
jgi:thiamine pyrophosphokinase